MSDSETTQGAALSLFIFVMIVVLSIESCVESDQRGREARQHFQKKASAK